MANRRDTRKILVETALGVFHCRSCAAVSVDAICREAGVNKGSFYHCFPSKTDIVLAVIEEAWRRQERDVLGIAFDPVYPPLHRVRRYFEITHSVQKADYQRTGRVHGCLFCNLGCELSTLEPIIQERLQAVYRKQVSHIEKALEAALKDGLYSGEPHTSATAIYNLLCGSIFEAKVRNDPDAIARTLNAVARCLGFEVMGHEEIS